uniref:(northern house mosquito) hypothetical protein n=1 Tax=Culex pipiens TaxID=7175 RepID=A0A8D8KNE1_CULPI
MSRRGQTTSPLRVRLRCPDRERYVQLLQHGTQTVLLRIEAVQGRFEPDDELLREERKHRIGSFHAGLQKVRPAGRVQALHEIQADLQPVGRVHVQAVRRRSLRCPDEAIIDQFAFSVQIAETILPQLPLQLPTRCCLLRVG